MRNGSSGGMKPPVIISNSPHYSGKAIHSYGTLVVDVCTGSICVHDGVTPGGCYCFQQQTPLCDQLNALPDLGNICPPLPDPAPFDPCQLMNSLPDLGAVCPPLPAPPPFDPCALMNSLPDLGVTCPPVAPPPPYDPCSITSSLPDFGRVC